MKLLVPGLGVVVLSALAGCARLDDMWRATGRTSSGEALSDASISLLEPPPVRGDDASARVVAEDDDAGTVAPEGAPSAADAGAADAGAADAGGDGAVAAAGRPTITALAARTGIVERPQSNARWVGYLRAGATLPIVAGPVGNDGCPPRRGVPGAGWYEVEGGGFVCVGYLADLSDHVTARALQRAPTLPDVDAALPFPYAINYRPTVMYRWLPSEADQREVEPERFSDRPGEPTATANVAARAGDGGVANAPAQPTAAEGAPTEDAGVRLEDLSGEDGSPLLRRMLTGMYVSLDRQVHGWWRTQSGGYVRGGSLSTVRRASSFQGVRLDETHHLPVAFAISTATSTYQVTPGARAATALARVPRLTVFYLTPEDPITVGREQYYHTTDGTWVRSRQVRVVTAHTPPVDLLPGEKWVDVNLDHQSVVAYEGATPVYVTVASTGRRNRNNPDENYETIQGEFRIQSKHVATTMDGNSANDGPYSIEDVPWVMYFESSFALHGAFWHNVFGVMHSHGCVNLAPHDARWLFGWTEPQVPPGWHGTYATATRPGTRVFVHYDHQSLGERGGPERPPQH